MNLKEHIILIKDIDKTHEVEMIDLQEDKYIIRFCNSNKTYNYSRDNVVWLTNPVELNIKDNHVYIRGKREEHIRSLFEFTKDNLKFYAIEYNYNFIKHYQDKDLEIRTSCLKEKAIGIFDFFKQCAEINALGVENNDDSTKGLLASIYSNIEFIDNETAAAIYLNQTTIKPRLHKIPIFPFGCNASQERAVKAALTHQMSVIQGPPGTGKTQTILNIIANLLVDGKSVLVVSNNNSATENVMEKLAKSGLGFLVAPLGKKANKEAFVANQPKINPNIRLWHKSPQETNASFVSVKENLLQVEELFLMQERLAILRQELSEICVEKHHFDNENSVKQPKESVVINTNKILDLLNNLKNHSFSNSKWYHIKNKLQNLYIQLKLRFLFKINTKLSLYSISEITNCIEHIFYTNKISELQAELKALELNISILDAKTIKKTLTDSSTSVLRANLAESFDKERNIFQSIAEIFYNGESFLKDYPVVLSTTFSSKLCFDSNTLFDYVIMDEASQVSVETGFLALTCAKNAVIVGDTMQLPNVICKEDFVKLEEIEKSCDVPDGYNPSKHNFLSSVLAVVKQIPETLLREHYRCHPDIINFCNQKFYGGNLLIMTNRRNDDKPLLAITTSKGHHSRGHYNQREIDTVKIELLPQLDKDSDIGIITPYNRQVEEFHAQLPEVETATVHKYQGREKDVIIMSVTDDVISDFSDNANLLNVAVSRAKKKFCLVVSGNSQNLKGNIQDLLDYIRYQHCTVIESKLHSIYDHMHTELSIYQKAKSTISKYDSENLTFDLIEKIRKEVQQLSHIKVLCHYPLRSLIANTEGLSEREKRYVMHPATHIDFLIINRVTKEPLLAIETDGYNYHNNESEQSKRDKLKDHILELYGLPLLRLSTIGHSEEQQIINALLNK